MGHSGAAVEIETKAAIKIDEIQIICRGKTGRPSAPGVALLVETHLGAP